MIARAKRVHVQEDRFVEMLPTLLRVIRHRLRHQPRHEREELAAEALAAAFVMYARLCQRGKQDLAYATPLGSYGARQAIDGRQVGSGTNVQDISSRCCRQRKGVSVTSLDRYDQKDEEWKEIVVESKTAGPDQIATIRIDFAAWLKSLPRMKRQMAKFLAAGQSTQKTARKFHVSSGRVSQVRRELAKAWFEFVGEEEQAVAAATA
jgi:hypothetical protein